MIAAARQLGPLIRGEAARIETEGQLTAEVAQALTRAQIFQMYLPAVVGGPEVHPLTAFAVCDELARHDGSVGWCAQVASATTTFLAWLDPEVVAEMVATTDGPLHLAGSARPLGTAERDGDGFRVTGHWNYASGVAHANWFLATSFVINRQGQRVPRTMLVPVADGEVVPNWEVVGMRGTGSDDFVLDGVFVPRAHSGARRWRTQRHEPLFDPRWLMAAAWAPTGGVGVGLAQGAIDALAEVGDLASTGSPTPLRERAAVQEAMARAEAITASARAFCVEAIGSAWDAIVTGPDDTPEVQRAVARAQTSITHALNEAVRVADLCFHAAGTTALSHRHRLERYLRDAHTAVQHAAGQAVHLQGAGRVLLGLEPGPPPGPERPV